jgi:lysyl endopeptidase
MRLSHLFLALLLAGGAAAAAPLPAGLDLPPVPQTAVLQFDALDRAKIDLEDLRAQDRPAPFRYALAHPVDSVKLGAEDNLGGHWSQLPDGRWLWRLPIRADHAVSIDLYFKRWRLPQGAELWFSDAKRSVVHGPYTDANNPREGGLALPLVPGAEALVELVLPADKRALLALELGHVSHGYRSAADALKSGSCNIDTICTEGDAWREQIRSVGRYTFSSGGSGFLCTGQLLNRGSGDRAPLLLTANHCLATDAEAATVVVYWKYESPTCRTVNSGDNGSALPISLAAASQSGASLVATYAPSDMTLLRLNQAPPAAADAFWSGWDRRNLAPSSGVAIHHPQGHEKRISIENDPLTISDYEPSPGGNATTHLKVFDWDAGTTEGGSSGSGIWNADKRLVGTLHGGFAACGNSDADYYGRLFTSWAGGGSAASRLSDHLDPAAANLETLDGRGSCDAPVVALATSGDPVVAGSDMTYSVTATGGSGGYRYAWDIDGDGVYDKENATASTLVARYNRETQFNASVRVSDSSGCTTTVQRAVSVIGHRIRLASSLGQPAEVCGDGDSTIEPGERWRLTADLTNAGERASGAEALSLFTKSTSDSVASAPSDGFGYRVTNSTLGAQCGYQFIDITDQVPALQLTAASSVSASDDGRTGVLDLAAVNGSFNFYGQTVSQVVMSTNGYIGTSAATTGGDYQNRCDGNFANDDNGSRLAVLHDDLVAGSLRWASYAQCPRPSEVAPSNQRCLVFQWNDMGLYSGSGATPTGDFDFQAVIYPQTWQIVYQYRNQVPDNGDGATVGIADPSAGGRLLNASCDEPAVSAPRAVCFYHPQNLPPASADLAKLRMENPLIAVGAMAPGATQQVSTFFALDPTTSCGSRYRIGLAGSVDDQSGNFLNSTREFLVGAASNCNVSNNCAVSVPPTVNLRPGAFFNPRRPGNGLVSHVVPVQGQLPVFFAAWYTGAADRTPIWYIVQGRVQDNQVVAPILKVTRNTAASGFSVQRESVGNATVQFVSPERIVFNYYLESTLEGGTEILTHGFQGLSAAAPNRTGTWFYAQEDGWGQTYDSYVTGGLARDFITTYLYDASGQPRWVLTDGLASDTGNLPTKSFRIHCPSCGWFDFFDSEQSAGTMRRSWVAPNSGTLSTGFALPAPMSGTWNRSEIPISLLTPVQPGAE